MIKKTQKALWLVLFTALSCFSAYAQSSTITGTVVDEAGEPIIGAYITYSSNTSVGAITDFDGEFELSVPGKDDLIFSYTGYETQKVSQAGKKVLNVTLKEVSTTLNEIVAIGYGSQTKKELTGSVTSVKSENFNQGSFNSTQGLLQGKVAGLSMSKSGGNDPANRDYNVQIRGTGSLTGTTSPLYIIDGVPGASMNNVNPNDIESMDVLKDGSAAAIYGTRANAGVVIVTTKKGKEGKTLVEYNGSVRTDMVNGKINVLSADEYVARGGVNYGYQTDWFKEITQVPISTEHNLALSGGMEKVNYRASVNFKDNNGLARNSSYQEIIGRVNVNQKALNKMLEFNYDLSYSSTSSKWVDYAAFEQSIKYNPTFPIHSDPSDPLYTTYGGYYQNFDKNGMYNPVAIIDQLTKDGHDQTFLGSIRATLTPIKGLKISGFGSYQYYNQTTGDYNPIDSRESQGTNGYAKKYNQNNTTRMVEATAQYGNEIKRNAFTFLLGYAYQDFSKEDFSASNTQFSVNSFSYNALGKGQGLSMLSEGGSMDGISVSSYKEEWKLASFFGRFIYNYDQRYFFNASVRYEGSSKFGANNRWGWFPAVSASWLITNEKFMENQSVVEELKLRAGYGVTGNVPDDCYPWIGRMTQNEDYAYFGDKKVATWSLATNPNPNLKWETKGEVNVGVDFSFLKGRLTGSIDYYNRTTYDLLYNYAVDPTKYPVSNMLVNYGTLSNQGIEVSIGGIPVKTDKFVWNLGMTLAHNENKVVRLGNDEFKFPEADRKRGVVSSNAAGWTSQRLQYLEEGKSIGNFYGIKFSRIDENGVFYGFDKNGNEKKFSSLKESDKVILGNALPVLNWGISSMMTFYGVDLSFNLRGAFGGWLVNTNRIAYGNKNSLANGNMMICKDNDYATPKIMTDYYMESGTYAKLGDLTIGYTFNIKENVAKYLSKARIYVTGQNIVTLSNYSGIDPEAVNMTGLEPGIEELTYYPTARTFMLGVNLAF